MLCALPTNHLAQRHRLPDDYKVQRARKSVPQVSFFRRHLFVISSSRPGATLYATHSLNYGFCTQSIQIFPTYNSFFHDARQILSLYSLHYYLSPRFSCYPRRWYLEPHNWGPRIQSTAAWRQSFTMPSDQCSRESWSPVRAEEPRRCMTWRN
jgi:hypothetical protein